MAAEDRITKTGASGTQYEFEVYRWGTQFKPLGGVYLVLAKQRSLLVNYDLLYIGQTGDLSERFENHHQAGCFNRYGRTHIAIKLEGSEQKRFEIA
jgi:hypothetical protein